MSTDAKELFLAIMGAFMVGFFVLSGLLIAGGVARIVIYGFADEVGLRAAACAGLLLLAGTGLMLGLDKIEGD